MNDGTASFGICQFTTLVASFEEDLDAYREAGVEGIGICELKLKEGADGELLAAFRRSGLAATGCVPAIPSILPLPLMPGPSDPAERVQAIRASIRRLAPFEPRAYVCLTGPRGTLAPEKARWAVLAGLSAIAEEAVRLGIPVGLEPLNSSFQDDWTTITTISEAVELLDDVGSEALGITFDIWHLWEAPGLYEDVERHGDRIVAVHVSDWREPTRSWCDRVLPGDGAIDLPAVFRALREAGWDGAYDLEIFSDNGTFGNAYPDSLWDVDARELARRGREAFLACWEGARSGPG